MSSNDIIDRLLSLEHGFTDLNAVNDAVDKIERLRELLRQCQPYVGTLALWRNETPFSWDKANELFNQIEKEVGDE